MCETANSYISLLMFHLFDKSAFEFLAAILNIYIYIIYTGVYIYIYNFFDGARSRRIGQLHAPCPKIQAVGIGNSNRQQAIGNRQYY